MNGYIRSAMVMFLAKETCIAHPYLMPQAKIIGFLDVAGDWDPILTYGFAI